MAIFFNVCRRLAVKFSNLSATSIDLLVQLIVVNNACEFQAPSSYQSEMVCS